MKKTSVKIISAVLSLAIIFSCAAIFPHATVKPEAITVEETAEGKLFDYLTNNNPDPEECSNSVVIPGVFQSKVRLYNDDGSIAVNSDGEEYSAPFFLEGTGEIVKKALKNALLPLLTTLLFQHDFGGKLATSVADTLAEILAGNVESDSDGKFIKNLKADCYPDSVATLSEEDKKYIYDQIPLNDYAEICGEDHLYFFSYASFGNINAIVDELYQLIVKAANASPTGKANIIPISQGGSLAVDLLDRYPEVGQYLDRIIYIVPALDGTILLGEIFEKGLIDSDDALYRDMFPILLDDDDEPSFTGSLVNIAIRLLPKKVVNNILDKAVDALIGDRLQYSTCMWALVSSDNYAGAAKKYLSDFGDEKIRAQTDRFNRAQKNNNDHILYQMENYGVEVFDIVDYNSMLYPIVESWNSLNADGVIHLSSTSIGSYSVAVDTPLPDNYVPVKGEKYVDKYRLVDAGAGLLPDSTFYFHNQNHERTAQNDVIMKLAICLLTDGDFTSVDSYPEKYPQFNECRNSRDLRNLIRDMKKIDPATISAEDAATLSRNLEYAEAVIANTVVDPAAYSKALNDMRSIRNKIYNINPDDKSFEDKVDEKTTSILADVLGKLSAFLYNTFGGKGFSDIINPLSYIDK